MRSYSRNFFLLLVFLLTYMPGKVFAGNIIGTVKVKGLRAPENILVYLSEAPAVSVDVSNAKFIMDQNNLTFTPHLLPVMVGTTVHFPNNDKVSHNVFSLSKTKTFNLGSYEAGESKTVIFDKPGIVELRCDVHAEMAAYIIVLKNPYWAITDSQGGFEIPDSKYLSQHGIKGVVDLSPGKYILKTWHEKLKSTNEVVEIQKSGEVNLELNLGRGVPGVLYK